MQDVLTEYGRSAEQIEIIQSAGRRVEVELGRGCLEGAVRACHEAAAELSPATYDTPLPSTPLAEIGLTMRVLNTLQAEPYRCMTVGAAMMLDRQSLLVSNGFGPSSLDELTGKLLKYCFVRCQKSEERLAQLNAQRPR